MPRLEKSCTTKWPYFAFFSIFFRIGLSKSCCLIGQMWPCGPLFSLKLPKLSLQCDQLGLVVWKWIKYKFCAIWFYLVLKTVCRVRMILQLYKTFDKFRQANLFNRIHLFHLNIKSRSQCHLIWSTLNLFSKSRDLWCHMQMQPKPGSTVKGKLIYK